MALKAGTARANITPHVGMLLSGFGGRRQGTEGIHDDLHARAVVLDDGDTKVALVSCDLIGFSLTSIAAIRERAEKMTGIPGENMLIAATHTHSGPAMGILRMRTQDPEWVSIVQKKVAGAIAEAQADLVDAALGVGVGSAQIGINRRERTPEGNIKLGKNPSGPIDTDVGVVRIDSADGARIATIVHHPCHPVVLGGSNNFVSADFPGAAMGLVERAKPDMRALFINGCAGNINSVPVGGTFDDVERLGTTLGTEALRTYETIEGSTDIQIRCAAEQVEVPLQELPPAEDMEKLIEQRKRELGPDASPEAFAADRLVSYARDVIGEHEGVPKRSRSIEMQAIALGDAVFVTTPGETFVEIAQAIKAGSPFEHTFVTGYTNGVIGYIPTAKAFDEGGYEVTSSFQFYYGTYFLAPGVEKAVVDAGIRLTQRVWPNSREATRFVVPPSGGLRPRGGERPA